MVRLVVDNGHAMGFNGKYMEIPSSNTFQAETTSFNAWRTEDDLSIRLPHEIVSHRHTHTVSSISSSLYWLVLTI